MLSPDPAATLRAHQAQPSTASADVAQARLDKGVPQRSVDTNDRRTPKWFYWQCFARYGPFDTDVAATAESTLCPNWFGPGSLRNEDGLAGQWGRHNWANPPYGPSGTIPKWIGKAREERDNWGKRTLLLLPADTSTHWFHDVSRTELIELVPFRLKFDGANGKENDSAKFGSVLVWIAPKITQTKKAK